MNQANNKPILICVIGVSGSGKSTVASRLAEHFAFSYFDADDFHSAENKAWMASGKALTDAMRIPWVNAIRHKLEQQAARSISCTLAFSGLRREHRQLLSLPSFQQITLFLKGTAKDILPRMQARSQHFMPPSLLESQFAALQSPEGEPGVFCIDIRQSIDDCVHEASDIIQSRYLQKT